jgi:predicted aspartyl protease
VKIGLGRIACAGIFAFAIAANLSFAQSTPEHLPVGLDKIQWSMRSADVASALPDGMSAAPSNIVGVLTEETPVYYKYKWKGCSFLATFYFTNDQLDHISLSSDLNIGAEACARYLQAEVVSDYGDGEDKTGKANGDIILARRQWCTPLTDAEFQVSQVGYLRLSSLDLSRRGAPSLSDPRILTSGPEARCPDQAPVGMVDCTLKQAASLSLKTAPEGLVSVPVEVDDKPERFVVDTGSSESSIIYRSAWAIGGMPAYKMLGGKYRFVGGIDVTQYTIANRFKVGSIEYDGMTLYLDPNRLVSADEDGFLGADVMKNYDVDFDYAHGKLGMFLPHACPGRAVYWTHGGYSTVPMKIDGDQHIRVTINLDGKSAEAAIDTGSYRSFIPAGKAKDLFGIDSKSPGVTSLGKLPINDGKPLDAYRYPFKAMSFGGVAVNNPDLLILPDDAVDGDMTIIIGESVLRQLHLYIAYHEGNLYVTPALMPEDLVKAAPAPPAPVVAPAKRVKHKR